MPGAVAGRHREAPFLRPEHAGPVQLAGLFFLLASPTTRRTSCNVRDTPLSLCGGCYQNDWRVYLLPREHPTRTRDGVHLQFVQHHREAQARLLILDILTPRLVAPRAPMRRPRQARRSIGKLLQLVLGDAT